MNKVNVYGSFTQALLFSGMASIPKLLLDRYHELGITNEEIVLILHIINNPTHPSTVELSQKMNLPVADIERMLAHLQDLKFLTVEKSWDYQRRVYVQTYNLVGLIEQLADLWAIEKFKEFEADRRGEKTPDSKSSTPLVKLFEQEIGRPLTAMECEQIERWLLAHYPEELIIEALRRGVSAGIRNFRYIDSILREWEKKGLKTLAEVEADDLEFQNRQEKKIKNRELQKKSYDKYKNIYL